MSEGEEEEETEIFWKEVSLEEGYTCKCKYGRRMEKKDKGSRRVARAGG